ncbi:MAG: hypothetical protein C3F12_00005, partial [Candidatus Methylomirabilota bacterium]
MTAYGDSTAPLGVIASRQRSNLTVFPPVNYGQIAALPLVTRNDSVRVTAVSLLHQVSKSICVRVATMITLHGLNPFFI